MVQVVAWFHGPDGEYLNDFDRHYTTGKEQVGSDTSVVPTYDPSEFGDCTIFIPYEQLHLAKGTHRLGVTVGIFHKGAALAYEQRITPFDVECK